MSVCVCAWRESRSGVETGRSRRRFPNCTSFQMRLHNPAHCWPCGISGKFASGSPGAQTEFEYTFAEPGVFPYHCRSHSGRMQVCCHSSKTREQRPRAIPRWQGTKGKGEAFAAAEQQRHKTHTRTLALMDSFTLACCIV